MIGVGAPTGGAAALAARWFRDNPQYVNVPMGDETARDSKLEGMFVGQDQGGPLGIIGTWDLTGGAFGISDSTQDVRGALARPARRNPRERLRPLPFSVGMLHSSPATGLRPDPSRTKQGAPTVVESGRRECPAVKPLHSLVRMPQQQSGSEQAILH